MEASFLVTGTMALVGAASGIWGLVLARDAKRKQSAVGPISSGTSSTISSGTSSTITEAPPINIPSRIDEAVERLVSRVVEIPEPTWHKEMLREMTLVNERVLVAIERPLPPQPKPVDFAPVAESLNRMGTKLERLVAQGDEPVPPQQVEFPFIERQLANLTQQLQWMATRQGAPPASEAPRNMGPASHAQTPLNLTKYNTVALPENVVYECFPGEPDIYALNIFNLGPAPVLMRDDIDPFFGDAHSSILAPQMGLNNLHVPQSINLLADQGGTTLSITLTTTVF